MKSLSNMKLHQVLICPNLFFFSPYLANAPFCQYLALFTNIYPYLVIFTPIYPYLVLFPHNYPDFTICVNSQDHLTKVKLGRAGISLNISPNHLYNLWLLCFIYENSRTMILPFNFIKCYHVNWKSYMTYCLCFIHTLIIWFTVYEL